VSKNLNQDQFDVIIVGNLISEPSIIEDEDGNKVCFCRVATNPKAKKFDQRTGKELTPEERNKRRSFIELKITKTSAAEKFMQMFSQGDRIRVEGEIGTKRIEKAFWSKKEGKSISVTVDVDDDGQNVQEILEDRMVMWVYNFNKVTKDQHGNTSILYA
jgi:single-stranded DNA-binding protein